MDSQQHPVARPAWFGTLGTLERRVMEALWAPSSECSVKDVCTRLGDDLAYTTIMTTLDRLYRKRLLDRRKEGRAFLYRPACSLRAFQDRTTRNVLAGLLGQSEEIAPVLNTFVDVVTARDQSWLDELERLVRRKRAELDASS